MVVCDEVRITPRQMKGLRIMNFRSQYFEDILPKRLSRRTLLRGMLFTPVVAAIPALTACDDDDESDDVADAEEPDDTDSEGEAVDDEELQQAMEQAEEETDFELDATNGDDDRTFPDDFPANIPVPEDAEIISDMSSSRDDEREIYISFVSDENRAEWVDTYDTELANDYEMDSEYRNDELETDEWDFNGGDWEWARVQLTNPQPDVDGEFQVLVILRAYIP
jgi:hypothetical protein